MRIVTLFFLLFIGFQSFAQEPTYTPMRSNYKFRGIRIDSLLIIPTFPDTSTANSLDLANINGNFIRVDTSVYFRYNQKWLKINHSGSGTSIDTTSLSNRINNKVDTIYKVGDSVMYQKNGTVYFAFKDSSGGGSTPSLQQVTDVGDSTNNTINLTNTAMLRQWSGDKNSNILFQVNDEGTVFTKQLNITNGYNNKIVSISLFD